MTSDEATRPAARTTDELRAEIAEREWFHSIDLGNDIVTPGYEDTRAKLPHMHLPDDFSGKSVIDIGAYDGFFSFEAERRGASRVLATDGWCWTWPGNHARGNFELAREVLGSKVESQLVTVEELSPEAVGGTFDVALFLGVLYHSPDPLGYLRRVRGVTSEMAIIETVVDLLDVEVPAIAFYPGASFNGDGSNHFGPNVPALEGLVIDAGFSRCEVFEPWITQPLHTLQIAGLDGAELERLRAEHPVRSGRLVAYAYV